MKISRDMIKIETLKLRQFIAFLLLNHMNIISYIIRELDFRPFFTITKKNFRKSKNKFRAHLPNPIGLSPLMTIDPIASRIYNESYRRSYDWNPIASQSKNPIATDRKTIGKRQDYPRKTIKHDRILRSDFANPIGLKSGPKQSCAIFKLLLHKILQIFQQWIMILVPSCGPVMI